MSLNRGTIFIYFNSESLYSCFRFFFQFIDGRVFIQTGKIPKPAQVTYDPKVAPFVGKPITQPAKSSKTKSNADTTVSKVSAAPEATEKLLPISEPGNKKEVIFYSLLVSIYVLFSHCK